MAVVSESSEERIRRALDAVRAEAPGVGVVTDQSVVAGYVVDWTGGFRGFSPAVLVPRTVGEVSQVLRILGEFRVPLVPQGGNTGLVGGGIPHRGEIVLSLRALDSVGKVSDDGCVTVGAGVSLAVLDDLDSRFECGIRIASRDSATVGGAIATNAGGLRVVRWGHMRASVRGLEMVLADGTVVSHMAGLVKDNTGYDYPSIIAGSEGTLAVVTGARLQLRPRPASPTVAVLGAVDADGVFGLANSLKESLGGHLWSAEFFTRFGLRVLREHCGLGGLLEKDFAYYLLVESDDEESLFFALDDCGVEGESVVVGVSEADRRRLWEYRELHPQVAGFLGPPLKFDVSAPTDRWPELIRGAIMAAKEVDEGAHLVRYGHILDGNVHMNIVADRASFEEHAEALFSVVAGLGGSISAEHGIGVMKKDWLHLARSREEMVLFQSLRDAFDPGRQLNPNVLTPMPENGWTDVTGLLFPGDG